MANQENQKGPKLSATKLTVESEEYLRKTANPETGRKALRVHNYHGQSARRKPFVSAKNIKLRK